MAGYDGACLVTVAGRGPCNRGGARPPPALAAEKNGDGGAIGSPVNSPSSPSPPLPLTHTLPGGAVYYNDQDFQWADDGGRSALASKQAARGKFFALLSRQRRGGARAADGVEVIG